MSTQFHWKATNNGIVLALLKKKRLSRSSHQIPTQEWSQHISSQQFSVVGRILDWLDDDSEGVTSNGDEILIPHKKIASLQNDQAKQLGLPDAIPHVLKVRAEGTLRDENLRIYSSWHDVRGTCLPSQYIPDSQSTHNISSIVCVDSQNFRIPQVLFTIINGVSEIRIPQNATFKENFRVLAELNDFLSDQNIGQLEMEGTLQEINVQYASGVSLSIFETEDGINFNPILFGERAKQKKQEAETEGTHLKEGDALLRPVHQENFQRTFKRKEQAENMYVLKGGAGLYVYVDDSLKNVLEVIRQKQKSTIKERWEFARSPQATLKEILHQDDDGSAIEDIFIETAEYSERVISIGLWDPPVLPWIKNDNSYIDWLPSEAFGVRINGKYIPLDEQAVTTLRDEINVAIKKGSPIVSYEGHDIPAHQDTLDALSHLIGISQPNNTPDPQTSKTSSKPKHPYVLQIKENLEGTEFYRQYEKRNGLEEITIDQLGLKSTLKPHQEKGIKWLLRCWQNGYPGVLLADDMGLGKTLQTLVFMMYVQQMQKTHSFQKPSLIIAPKTLLENWQLESKTHFNSPNEISLLYGARLKALRSSSLYDNRDSLKSPGLNLENEAKNGKWLLTTYETLRDHHISFGHIKFSCAIFDEIQKAKNPSSLISHATKTVNADFSIGLTGTPVENRLEDLWTIMDILHPNYLGDLRSFCKTYNSQNAEDIKKLRDILLNPQCGNPPVAFRRMKVNNLEGLTNKKEHHRKGYMPEAQSQAYDSAIENYNNREKQQGAMLKLLQDFRNISLHPYFPNNTDENYPEQSARIKKLFDVLGEIKRKNEKVLIFIENLEMQDFLSILIKERYRLKRKPLLISGNVLQARRQKAVNDFQTGAKGFDVMILSPRAGGVGLTLTAANHVIHLSRWWNPAVEDQCTDRVYRIGQDKDVHVYYLMAEHSIHQERSFDIVLDNLLARKRKMAQELLLPIPNSKPEEEEFHEVLPR